MRCAEIMCSGEIDFDNSISLLVCRGPITTTESIFGCEKCNKLHWKDGRAVTSLVNGFGMVSYFFLDGELVRMDQFGYAIVWV